MISFRRLQNLVNSPNDAANQNSFSEASKNFEASLTRLRKNFQPAQIVQLEEIDAAKFFSDDIASYIRGIVASNAATLAVARDEIEKFRQEREQFIAQLKQLKGNLALLRIETDDLEAGEAEIGFLIPRKLFKNQLDQLIKELRELNRIIRAFSEATKGSIEPVEVRQISSSDPLFFFLLDPATIAAIGAAVTWALHTWKQLEEIREIRVRTERIDVLKNKKSDLSETFKSTMKEVVKQAVEEKTEEILRSAPDGSGRKHEQRSDISLALNSLLARIERGMTVEIRVLPPAQTAKEGETPEELPSDYQVLQNVADQLLFPKVEGDPILELPHSSSSADDDQKK